MLKLFNLRSLGSRCWFSRPHPFTFQFSFYTVSKYFLNIIVTNFTVLFPLKFFPAPSRTEPAATGSLCWGPRPLQVLPGFMRKYATIAIRDPDLFDSLFEVHVPLLNEEGQCQSGRPVMAALSALAHYPPLRLQPLRAEVFILSLVNSFFLIS